MPTISVIVPVYKVEPYLARCVDSILGQTYRDFELILVDDGSPDNCGAMCDAYAEKDSRIHVIHQENGGLSAARNTGMDWVYTNSDSQWLSFIDSDDWVHRDYLKTMLEAAVLYGTTQAMCGMLPTEHCVLDEELPAEYHRCVSSEQAYIMHYNMCIRAWGKILHRSLLSEIRFPVGKLHEDAFVTHLLTFASEKIAVCDVALYYYFTNPGSITRVKWSERRLHQFEGHELRLAYLRDSEYPRAYIAELEAYTHALFAQVQDLRILSKTDPVYRSHYHSLRKKAIPVFHEARGQGLFPYAPEFVWIYELVYPIKPVWAVRNILKKLFR